MKKQTVSLLFFAIILVSIACNLLSASDGGEDIPDVPTSLPTQPTSQSTAPEATLPPSNSPPAPAPQGVKIPLPPAGYLYHSVYPGGKTGEESDVTQDDLRTYEDIVRKNAVWVYFSHNWYQGHEFPLATAAWIREAGSIPYIRLMLRSDSEQNHAEPLYTFDKILNGDFDADLQAWASAARDFGTPLIAEYGVEVNGEWFSWNGMWYGAGKLDGYGDPTIADGPEQFRDVYRHIIQISRDEKADNITWVFHVNNQDIPDEDWNRLEQYYPGDEWIDWLGVSAYGAQTPMETEWPEFRDLMDAVYPRLEALSPDKPIVLLEFGAAANNPLGDQAAWARSALTDIISFRWPRLICFSWWNEAWPNDDNPAHDTTMRVQDNPALAAVFQELVGQSPVVLGEATASGQPAAPTALPLPPTPEITSAAPLAIWQPGVNTTWQWQLSGDTIDQSFEVDMYDIDLFDSDVSVVAALHEKGRKVVCYISVGSWEDWRPDQDQFPEEVIGKNYQDWPGEKWLDIRQIELLAPVMRARLDLCRDKGFDAIEPDNIDGYTNDTGFPLTYDDQLKYNRWLADEAHARGLSIGLKNDPDQAVDLLPFYDWAMTEDCFDQGWCEKLLPFIQAGKAVFAAEYTDTGITLDQFCPLAKTLKFSAILKHRDLDAWRETCPSQATDAWLSPEKWSLWAGGTQLRGANIYQRRIFLKLDGGEYMGPGPFGPPFEQADFDNLAALGANYVNFSVAGLYTMEPPYEIDDEAVAHLDRLLEMAAQAHLYAVISFRTGPGRSEFSIIHWGGLGR